MAIKYFNIEENQNIWNQFNEIRVTECINNNREKWIANKVQESEWQNKANQSVASVKKSVMKFAQFINKEFTKVTAEDLQEFQEFDTKGTWYTHVNSFMISCVNHDLLKLGKDTKRELMPVIYRKLMD